MMIKGLKVHLKEVDKHKDFSSGLILMGGLSRLKNEKFSKAISIFGHFKVGLPLDGFRWNFL
jgi:hypothetical protein